MEVICHVADAFLCGATFSLTGTIQSLSSKVKGLVRRHYIVHESPEFGLLILDCKFRPLKTTLVECFSGKSYSVIFTDNL